MRNSEKGQALPLALLVLAVGTLVIGPFISHASSNLIGSRIYGQVITEQYSCDAGIEWALWRLKENPVLTTNTTYDSTVLEPFPSEINSSSFPVTELRFIEEDDGGTEIVTPEWQDGQGWHDYPISLVMIGTLTVVIDNITASQNVQVRLDRPNPPYHFQGDGPYIAEFEIDYSGSCIVQVKLPAETKYGPLGPGPITITITYPIEGAGATETIIPEWLTGPDWVHYPFRATDAGIALVIVECDAPIVRIKLHGGPAQPGEFSYTADYTAVIDEAGSYEIWVQTRDITFDEEGNQIAVPYYGPGTITITYPIASYDIRAQKGDRTITVRATASYLATRVISWQVE